MGYSSQISIKNMNKVRADNASYNSTIDEQLYFNAPISTNLASRAGRSRGGPRMKPP
jgi:hypothetical protein